MIRYFFPNSANQLINIISIYNTYRLDPNTEKKLFGTFEKDNELNYYCKNKTTGLSIHSFIDKTEKITNAYTFPMFINVEDLLTSKWNKYSKIPGIADLYHLTMVYPKLIGLNIDGIRNNNKVNFSHNSNIPIVFIQFQTKPIIKKLNIDQRFVLLLHELGHWRRKNAFLNLIETITRLEILPYLIAFSLSFSLSTSWEEALIIAIPLTGVIYLKLFLISNYLSTSAEFDADGFVKQLGYGKEAIEINNKIFNKNNTSKLNKLQQLIQRFIYTHPSWEERNDKLVKENIDLSSKMSLITNIQLFLKILDEV